MRLRLYQSQCQEYSIIINQTCLSEPFLWVFLCPCVLLVMNSDPRVRGRVSTTRAVFSSCWRHENTVSLISATRTLTWKCWHFDWKKKKTHELLLHHFMMCYYSPAFSFLCYIFLCIHEVFFFHPQECKVAICFSPQLTVKSIKYGTEKKHF